MKIHEMIGLFLIGWSTYYINKLWAAMAPGSMFVFYFAVVPIVTLAVFAIRFRKKE